MSPISQIQPPLGRRIQCGGMRTRSHIPSAETAFSCPELLCLKSANSLWGGRSDLSAFLLARPTSASCPVVRSLQAAAEGGLTHIHTRWMNLGILEFWINKRNEAAFQKKGLPIGCKLIRVPWTCPGNGRKNAGPTLSATVAAIRSESASERRLAGNYENLVNKRALDATASTFGSTPGGQGGWVSTWPPHPAHWRGAAERSWRAPRFSAGSPPNAAIRKVLE